MSDHREYVLSGNLILYSRTFYDLQAPAPPTLKNAREPTPDIEQQHYKHPSTPADKTIPFESIYLSFSNH